jgi:beta-galactosidase
VTSVAGNRLALEGSFDAVELCEIVHLRGASALAVFDEDFYAGHPAFTVHDFGRGRAYYVAARFGEPALKAFYRGLIAELELTRPLSSELPGGVMVQLRKNGAQSFLFVINFSREPQAIPLDREYTSLVDQRRVRGTLELGPFGGTVLAY